MRPRLGDGERRRGNGGKNDSGTCFNEAPSWRRGKVWAPPVERCAVQASMRPRLGDGERPIGIEQGHRPRVRFNEAPSWRRGKGADARTIFGYLIEASMRPRLG